MAVVGVRPSVLIGHSVGEIVAATVAGLFTLADGVTFLAARSRLIESVSAPGGMAAVAAPAEEVRPLLLRWPELAVAAVNAPEQCVVSGGAGALAEAVEALRARDWTVTPLHVTAAFHSPLMEEVAEPLAEVLRGIAFQEPRLPIVSNLTGRVAAPRELATPEYWVRHMTRSVEFAAGVRTIAERGRHVFLELGPSTALTSLARQAVPQEQHRWLSCLRRKDTTGATLDAALAGAYTAGLTIAWNEVHADGPGRRIPLPGYAFDRRAYRLPARPAARAGAVGAGHPCWAARARRPATGGSSRPGSVRRPPRTWRTTPSAARPSCPRPRTWNCCWRSRTRSTGTPAGRWRTSASTRRCSSRTGRRCC